MEDREDFIGEPLVAGDSGFRISVVPEPFPRSTRARPFGARRMKDEAKIAGLRVFCWAVVVILPTGVICWLAHIHSILILAVALPFILVAERVFRRLLQAYELWGPKRTTEPGASPNGGPAERLGDSGVSGGPPSVS